MSAAEQLAEKTPAEELAERTAKAVAYGCRFMATDLALLLRDLPTPANESDRADKVQDATWTFTYVMRWVAAYTYGLCLMLRKDVAEAGKYYRLEEVQREMRDRALSVTRSVLEPKSSSSE